MNSGSDRPGIELTPQKLDSHDAAGQAVPEVRERAVRDLFARRIVGWWVQSMTADFVLDALKQALYARQPECDDSLVHHSDRDLQYVSIRYSERLAEAGIAPNWPNRTPCATALPRACFRRVTTSAQCRSYWGFNLR